MTREPVYAGQYYEKNKEELLKQIKECFTDDFGPGLKKALEKDRKNHGKIIGAVSPHAGYMFSGPAAAHVYKKIYETTKVDTFIILAPNHTGRGLTSLITDDYKTPLGTIRTNKRLAKKILEKTKIAEDNTAHDFEHSLEVQLPFIQYMFPKADIIPIIISSPRKIREISEGLRETLKDEKNICIIASSDFTHHGFNFGFKPFDTDQRKNIELLDKKAMLYIKKKDPKGFIEFIMESRATICGYLPIAIMMNALPDYDMKLLTYYTSSDILHRSEDSSVSYAGIVCEEKPKS